MKPGRVIVAALIAGVAAWGGVSAWRGRDGAPGAAGRAGAAAAADEDSTARAPAGARVRVRVQNATRTRGLARLATRYLRDRGFDVVEMGTAGTQRDSTLVLDHTGRADWAARVARAMGGARVEARPDSSRYLDVTVLVGRTWSAPAEPLYP